MTEFEQARQIISEATDIKKLEKAKETLYIHGLVYEMTSDERASIMEQVEARRYFLAEAQGNGNVKTLQDALKNAGFNTQPDETGVFAQGTFNALNQAMTKWDSKQKQGQLNESEIDEIAWLSLGKHKNIEEVYPAEWGPWAVKNPNDATVLVNKWLQNSMGNEDIILKVSQCILSVPESAARLRKTLCSIYNRYVASINGITPDPGNRVQDDKKDNKDNLGPGQNPDQMGPKVGRNQDGTYGPTHIRPFDYDGVVKNDYIKQTQLALKQRNFPVMRIDGTFDNSTLVACLNMLRSL